MDAPAIAKIAFTSEDWVREVIHNFDRDGFHSLAPKYVKGSFSRVDGTLDSACPATW